MLERLGIYVLILIAPGCNAFNFADSPSGDVQLLSAARACFDQGNYSCASKYYGQLSSTASDSANSESAFELLAQNGVSVTVFISAVVAGSESGGKLVTKMANALISNASETTRLGIFHAYQKNSLINDTRTRGLIRFVTALSLMSEILAEDATSSGLLKTDLTVSPTKCTAASPAFVLSADCGKPPGKKLISGTGSLSLSSATDAEMSGTPSLQMIVAAVFEINQGLTQMQATGSLGSSSISFASNILAAAVQDDPSESPGFRGALISYDVGD